MMRPKLLWTAAGILADMHNGKMKTRSLAVVREEERELNDCRLSGTGNYTFCRHIELLADYLTIKRKEHAKCT